MGQYLDIGLAKNIFISKRYMIDDFNDIKKDLGKALDLSIYDIVETDQYIELFMKKDIFENEIVDLMEEICKNASDSDKGYIKEKISKIKGKSHNEMIEEGNKHETGFCYSEGCRFTQDISYIIKNGDAFCDLISFIVDGKIIMECYEGTFYYLRNCIINSLKSPLRKSMVVTISG